MFQRGLAKVADTEARLRGDIIPSKVFSQPLLDQNAKRCTDESKGQTREPEDIDTFSCEAGLETSYVDDVERVGSGVEEPRSRRVGVRLFD